MAPPPCVAVGWAPPATGRAGVGAAETVMTDGAGMATVRESEDGWIAATSVKVVAAGWNIDVATISGSRSIQFGSVDESTASEFVGATAGLIAWDASGPATAAETDSANGSSVVTSDETGLTDSRVRSSGRKARGLRRAGYAWSLVPAQGVRRAARQRR